jgi:hypothetical protein
MLAMVDAKSKRAGWDKMDSAPDVARKTGMDVGQYESACRDALKRDRPKSKGFGPGHKLAPGRWRWTNGVWERA